MTSGKWGGNLLNTRDRAIAGCIVTFVNLDDLDVKVVHEAGYFLEVGLPVGDKIGRVPRTSEMQGFWESLKRVVAAADKWDGDWRVRTISSPQLIYQDMLGRTGKSRGGREQLPNMPEPVLLGRIGRGDMWWKA